MSAEPEYPIYHSTYNNYKIYVTRWGSFETVLSDQNRQESTLDELKKLIDEEIKLKTSFNPVNVISADLATHVRITSRVAGNRNHYRISYKQPGHSGGLYKEGSNRVQNVSIENYLSGDVKYSFFEVNRNNEAQIDLIIELRRQIKHLQKKVDEAKSRFTNPITLEYMESLEG